MRHFILIRIFFNSSRLRIRSRNRAPSWLSPWCPWLPTRQVQERYQGFRRCSCLWPLRRHSFDRIHLQSRGVLISVVRRVFFPTKIFLQGAAIRSNKQWMEVCEVPSKFFSMDFLGFRPESHFFQNYILGFAAILFVIFGLVVRFVKNRRANHRRPRLVGEEVSQVVCNDYGSITRTRREDEIVHKAGNTPLGRATVHRGRLLPWTSLDGFSKLGRAVVVEKHLVVSQIGGIDSCLPFFFALFCRTFKLTSRWWERRSDMFK